MIKSIISHKNLAELATQGRSKTLAEFWLSHVVSNVQEKRRAKSSKNWGKKCYQIGLLRNILKVKIKNTFYFFTLF